LSAAGRQIHLKIHRSWSAGAGAVVLAAVSVAIHRPDSSTAAVLTAVRRRFRPRLVAEVVPVRASEALGRYGEELAARRLSEAGMVVLARNWRCAAGEIDIVARDGDVLVICEVKTRSGEGFGSPLEAVTAAKAARLRRLAMAWLAEHDVHPAEIRIDVVGIVRGRSGGPSKVEHVRGVV
jgi:putative endonuclease